MIKDILPITGLKLEVMTQLYIFGEINLATISKNINLESSNTSRILKELKSIIEKKSMGKINMYKLVEEDKEYFEIIIERYRLEKCLGVDIKIIGLLKNSINIKAMYLFGSYVKGTQKKISDIDILIISDEKKDILKNKVNKISKLVHKTLEIQHFNSKEYEMILNDKNSIFNSILKDKYERIKIV